ncbi:tetratricopeptide repeat protein [Nitratiruptor sp. YY09-18]|uniref:tetratricopeptide repeat protein n=1 Tax=Nitratiruptor sp. YY09-18 TaxID=2724901 RepID=UPI00191633C1|nr:tetratricopeptide repeat protein [Nitratiruptor sp. YY09-18]BCD68670.1 hypothetical protein NitYY0918_C1587 [Nitratiruptor sp. YY09-18]
MISKFEELERRCKRRKLKRFTLLGLLIVILTSVAWYGYSYMQKSSYVKNEIANKQKESPAPRSNPSSKPATKSLQKEPSPKPPERKCFGIQVMYAYDTMMDNVFNMKLKALKMGIPCHIRYGKTLENGKKEVYLICATSPKKSALKPLINQVKRLHWDYVVVNDECRYVEYKKRKKRIKEKRKEPIISTVSAPKEQKVSIETKSVDVEALKKLYSQRKSYDLAMKIAKSYYAKSNYSQAAKWAKRANRLDPQQEGAWILYAKSLYKKGYKTKAKEVLRAFLDFKDSKQAKKLLESWQ